MKKFSLIIPPIILAILTWCFYYIFTINVNDKIFGNAHFYFTVFAYLNIAHLSYFVYMLYLRSNKRIGTIITLLSLPPFPVYLVILMTIDFVVSALPL
ncbi:MAG: hypothetical protein CO029_01705 [Candidatus Magasanikbacteria bacterium CG_4_9_14_0_2_um_filter_41_10]|uniref:Uncharacterized protein n=1 Tax=Candidatus Magasanikbacteria bacterium CG_4_10_14_0_2_um_filter_41_31 TaxID=1974639 RepID=A0A2M7V491_9BACT|nr:MAG: hypothetical protein AUJ37_00755 [Candidatus Magasanikbacteria bacterium CG1_02_41_34]PIZ93357.1 MAG: hypothetical protein COX83_02240 [Candidatus Magasanikbacteria bacterium CG_4_10_14_0_2_um_filter_41_31]PJC53640.1 MAG: hypothetical protein CO029_01705 [Candidatus Magasanikbacteria bacterium CG_4_9_14_0_2_um_filter_41_10]